MLGGVTILKFSEKCIELDRSSIFKFMVSLILLTITAPIRLVCEIAVKIMLTTKEMILRVLITAVLLNIVLLGLFVLAYKLPFRFVNVSSEVALGSLALSILLLIFFFIAKDKIMPDSVNIYGLLGMDDEYDEYDDEYEDEYEDDYEDGPEEPAEESADEEIFTDPTDDAFAIFDNEQYTEYENSGGADDEIFLRDKIDISEFLEDDLP